MKSRLWRDGAAFRNCLASLWPEGGGTWFALQGSELNDTLNRFFWEKIYETQLRCTQKT